MTDIFETRTLSIEPTRPIHGANEKMIACVVRWLFVLVNQNYLTGLMTSTDILGAKPLKYLSQHGVRREELYAGDVKAPLSKLETSVPSKSSVQLKMAWSTL